MKTIKLSVEQAKELYNTNKEFRSTILHEFTDSELGIEPILRDWEDLEFLNTFYSLHNGKIGKHIDPIIYAPFLNVPTEKHAKSMIAFAKLSMLMADLGDECNVDWLNYNNKYILYVSENKICKDFFCGVYHFLAFKTESIRDAFLKKHERLIKDYFMID